MNYKEILEEIVRDVSYKTEDGIPNWKNPQHVTILSEVLDGSPLAFAKTEIIRELIREENEVIEINGKVSIGGNAWQNKNDAKSVDGGYEKNPDKPTYTKDDSDTFTEVSPESDKKEPKVDNGKTDDIVGSKGNSGSESGSETEREITPNLGTPTPYQILNSDSSSSSDIANAIRTISTDKHQLQIFNAERASNDEIPIIPLTYHNINRFDNDQEKGMSDHVTSARQGFKDEYLSISIISDNELRQEKMLEMSKKYGIKTNNPPSKIYITIDPTSGQRLYGNDRKVLGTGNGTVNMVISSMSGSIGSSLTTLGSDENQLRKQLSSASKADLGKSRGAKDDAGVQTIFSKPPLSRLTEKYQRVFGPTGSDGNLLVPSSSHSLEHLKHSVLNNKSLQKMKSTLKKADPISDPKLLQAIESHEARISHVLENIEVPSEEASKLIKNSYGAFAEDLANSEDPKMAGSIMKNVQEMALYDTLLAEGAEVYMPEHGSFPSVDIIRITRDGTGDVIKSGGISVKYGKTGKYGAWGFPGQLNQYSIFHEDEYYHDLFNARPFADGYSLGVKDSVVDNREEFDKLLSDAPMGDCVRNPDKLHGLLKSAKTDFDRIKSESGYDSSSEAKSIVNVKNDLKSKSKEHGSKILGDSDKHEEPLVDLKCMERMIGKENAKIAVSDPGGLIGMISMSAMLKTGGCLSEIEHNHAEVNEGSYDSHITTSEDADLCDMRNYKVQFRAFDFRSGGMITSLNTNRMNMDDETIVL